MAGQIESHGDPIALIPVQDVLTLIEETGYDAGTAPALLDRLHLPSTLLADPRGMLDPRHVWHFCSALGVELGDEQFGLASRPVPPGTTELLVSRAMHGSNLGEAMEAIVESARIVQPDLRFHVRRRFDELHFCMSIPDADSEAHQILLELTAVPFHCTFCWLSGTALSVQRVRTVSWRRSRATHFLTMFSCGVEFDGAGIDIVYPCAVADLPIVATDLGRWRTEMFGILLDSLEKSQEPWSSSDLTRYVERALRSGMTDQSAIAASAGMSIATLRRRLWRERTSFRALSDRILGEMARQHIDSGATVEEIAGRLGYRDARSFRRAFQRVVGETPAEYRRRNTEPRRAG